MGQVASTRECRLLAATASAYGIDVTGGFTRLPPYFDAVGFVDSPTAIVGGLDGVNACLVGTNRDDGVVVAFRGILPPEIHDLSSLIDWMQDFEAIPLGVPGIPGLVHQGIWNALETLWPQVVAEIAARQAAGGGGLPIVLTGHSKGGGMAHLAAMRLSLAGTAPPQVITYAAPRIGDQAFAEAYEQQVAAIRYEYSDDIVPHLPPDPLLLATLGQFPAIGPHFRDLRAWIYVSAGTLRFIDWNMQVVGDSESLHAERLARLALVIIQLQFGQIVSDHRAGCGFGYVSAVCPGLCSEADVAREAVAPRS
jgi:hypothetical protein